MKMKKEEFLKELENRLSEISEEERADAIAFYRSYLEDAGEENEDAVIAELESPEKVAENIIRDMGFVAKVESENKGDSEEGIYKSQDSTASNNNTGYYNSTADNNTGYYNSTAGNNTGYYNSSESSSAENSIRYEKVESGRGTYQEAGNSYGNTAKMDDTTKIILIIVVAVLTSPIWTTILGGIISLVAGVVAVLFGIFVTLFVSLVALFVVGVILAGVGIASIFEGAIAVGLGLIGGGFIVLALAVLVGILVAWLDGVLVPWAVKGISKVCKDLWKKGKECIAR